MQAHEEHEEEEVKEEEKEEFGRDAHEEGPSGQLEDEVDPDRMLTISNRSPSKKIQGRANSYMRMTPRGGKKKVVVKKKIVKVKKGSGAVVKSGFVKKATAQNLGELDVKITQTYNP